uniref:O-acyltransferase WSD1 C-terminal domain-containing protein n=1 Tax=Arcella intermedia TaxID=1963864 RepID=A0A6B2L935_9EUKA
MEAGRPLWRLDILRNAGGRSAVALIVDHAVGDGLGLLPVGLGGCKRLDGSPYVHEQYQARQKPPRKSPLTLIKSFFVDLFEVLWVASGPFDSICNISKNSAKSALDFNETKRKIATVPDFELSDILEIKKRLGNDYTVNDILTALWSGTLRRYLVKTQDPLVSSNQPILIRGQAPISLPRVHKKGEVFCKMVFMVFKFAVGANSIKERLAQVHQEFESAKNSLKVPLISGIGNLSLRLGLDDALINANTNQWHRTSFIFSNVMGPKEEIIMFGKKMVTFRPFYCNLIHQVIFFSYAGKVSLSMVLDVENIKHPNVLAQCCLDELEAMKKEILIS